MQLCSTFSSSLICHWCEELLAFICCELTVSWLLLLHRTGSEGTVSRCYPVHCIRATDDFTDHCDILLHSCFFPRRRLIGCFVIPYTIVLLTFSALSFSDLGDTSLAHSIQYVGILWIYMTEWCLFFSHVLCFPFSCLFLVICGTLLCWL